MTIEAKYTESLSNLLNRIPSGSEEYTITQDLLNQLLQFFNLMRETKSEEFQDLILDWEAQPTLFNEIGKVARSFYEQMKKINADIPERLGEIADHEVKDANQRLKHIVAMTEKAANKTMDLVEGLLNELENRDHDYQQVFSQIKGVLDTEDLPANVKDALQNAQSLLNKTQEHDVQHQAKLTDILIAQDYQDLTGQTINKTVNLLTELENELIGLIEIFGKIYMHHQGPTNGLRGPMSEDSEERQSQEDTDALLSSLGF